MEFGIISENTRINETIYHCLKLINPEDVPQFVKDFRTQPHNQNQVQHTFRELLLGSFLASNNYKIRRDYKINDKTPDWSIFNDSQKVIAIVELVNFHIDKNTEDEINKKKAESKEVWAGWLQSNNNRLWQRIQEKAEKYEKLAKDHNLHYVVSLFGEFTAFIEHEELNDCLFIDYDGGIFNQYKFLSGLLYFEESAGQYNFKYFRNPYIKTSIELPSGVF